MSGILRVRLDHVDARKGIIRLLSFQDSTMVHKTLSLEIGREVEIALPDFLFENDPDMQAQQDKNQKNIERIQELEAALNDYLVPQDEVHHSVLSDLRSENDLLRQDRQALLKLANSSSGAFNEMVNNMKVKELNQLLETASLSTEGNKEEKQERLISHFEGTDSRTKVNLLSHADANLEKAFKDDVSKRNKEQVQKAHRDSVEYNEAGGVKSYQQRAEEAQNREESSNRLDETEAAEDDGSGIDKQEDKAVRTNAPHEARDDHRQQTHHQGTEVAGKEHDDRAGDDDAGEAEETVTSKDESNENSGQNEGQSEVEFGEDQDDSEKKEGSKQSSRSKNSKTRSKSKEDK